MSERGELHRPSCYNHAPKRRLMPVDGQGLTVTVDEAGYVRAREAPAALGEVFYTLAAWRWEEEPAEAPCTMYRSGERWLQWYDCEGCRWARG